MMHMAILHTQMQELYCLSPNIISSHVQFLNSSQSYDKLSNLARSM